MMRPHLDDSLWVGRSWRADMVEAPYGQVPMPMSHSALGSALCGTDPGPRLD